MKGNTKIPDQEVTVPLGLSQAGLGRGAPNTGVLTGEGTISSRPWGLARRPSDVGAHEPGRVYDRRDACRELENEPDGWRTTRRERPPNRPGSSPRLVDAPLVQVREALATAIAAEPRR